MKALNPRIIRRPDGSALLTGVSYVDLCHILTLASIQQHDSERDLREKRVPEVAEMAARYRSEEGANSYMAAVVEDNLREERIFLRRIRATLDMLKARTSPRHTGDDGPISRLTRWQALRRLENVRSDRDFRRRIRAFLDERFRAKAS